MNKYLVKVAEKIELEPGVHYDTVKHQLVVAKRRMDEHIGSKDRTARIINAIPMAAMGTGAGWIGVDMIHSLPNGPLKRAAMTAAAGLGGALGGYAGYAVGGLQPYQRTMYKDNFTTRMEKKYDDRINEIEGW